MTARPAPNFREAPSPREDDDDLPVLAGQAVDEPSASASAESAHIKKLASLVSGCRNDLDGIEAKKALVASFVQQSTGLNANLLNVVCALHLAKCVTISADKLLTVLEWRSTTQQTTGGARAVAEAEEEDGFFLAQVLATCEPGQHPGVVRAYLQRNPQVDHIRVLQYVNQRGFTSFRAEAVVGVVAWEPPSDDEAVTPPWREVWGVEDEVPTGTPWFATLRDSRGRRTKLAFLGSITSDGSAPSLATPSQVMDTWKVPKPSLCVITDAGSMHPRSCDSIDKMVNLPQFNEWVADAMSKPEGGSRPTGPSKQSTGSEAAPLATRAPGRARVAPPSAADAGSGVGLGVEQVGGDKDEEAGSDHYSKLIQQKRDARSRQAAATAEAPAAAAAQQKPVAELSMAVSKPWSLVKLDYLMQRSVEQWREALPTIDTDNHLGDSSINNIIFTKLKEVFAALLDAATLAGNWIIVDRTDGSGSATAELLLEMALERGSSRPTILVIDSLERLGSAREGFRALKVLRQLKTCFANSDCTTQTPNGTERDFLFNYGYSLEEFSEPGTMETFGEVEDHKLPFAVIKEHQRKAYNNTCDPQRKWRYFYVDSLWASGTHIVLKNNDVRGYAAEHARTHSRTHAHADRVEEG